ncbi:PDZ domain-containing protein [Patescibacteria group bacterium]|nr:PDZ domain-containing protein [Patescibacteria group bacterium]MBU1683639.1 PDZ domain-containing protein [Patescibacteria group bacterium]MBU1935240.1 PDZ domain-containing protein [Patescibacteria group bacterium]
MKKLLASIILSVILFTSYTFAHQYEDIPNDHEYYYAIHYLRRNDVFMDTKEFNPDIIINRAEFIKYLVLLNDPDYTERTDVNLPFEDTQNNAWYASYFADAIDLGIISDEETKMYPYDKLTVVDALELLFHSQSIPIPKVYKGTIPYEDVLRNTHYAPLIMRALEFGIIHPESMDHVGFYKRVTRAEAAYMIYKMDLVNLTPPGGEANLSSFDSQLQKVIAAWDIIFSGYLNKDELDRMAMSDAAISAMVETFDDPYSAYLDREENTAFSDDLDGEIEGIGAYIGVNEEDEITIIAPMSGSPAEAAGVESGDIITKVDETDIEGLSLYEVVNLIKGPKGTTVALTVRRNGGAEVIEIVRDVITINSLEYEVIDNEIMRVKLFSFNQNLPDDFQEVVEIMENNSNIKGLIIDVRDNPGGLLDSAIRVLNHLMLPEAEIVTIKYNYFEYTQYSKGDGELFGYPTVVLINGGSASASEILAGALRDYDLATIIGEKSFGKGTVQEVNYFLDDSSLKITVAKWLTPLNFDIQKEGIEPHITVEDNTQTYADEQLERAISEINKMIR